MRVLPLILALMPAALWAGDIPLTSRVSDVTLYPQGATIHRSVPFTAPAGQHDLILIDLPRDTDLGSVRVGVTGATMGSVTARRDYVPPRDPVQSDAFVAAEADVERLERALTSARADIARQRLVQDAAKAQVAFLAQLGRGEGVAQMDVLALRDLAQMIGAQTLAARQQAHDADLAAGRAERALKDQIEALQAARQARDALIQDHEDRAMLAVSITSDTATEGVLSVTYQSFAAGWAPVYDAHLDRAAARLTLTRGAMVQQATGESWQDVNLTLSTVRPSGRTAPSDLWPLLRRIEDPRQPARVKTTGGALDMDMAAAAPEAMMAEPVILAAEADFDGLAVTYRYPQPVSIATGADALRIALGKLASDVEIEARAVPLYDDTAFLVARVTNNMGELVLPGRTSLYLDGDFMGQIQTDLLAAGGTADLPFGPIEGLRLTRTVLEREEGGSGVISKSNDLSERVRIEVENLTGEAWPLRLLDRVPYSEQEDLEISWTASPRPAEQDVEGQRGVLAWTFDLGVGENRVITVDHALQWPEEKVLR